VDASVPAEPVRPGRLGSPDGLVVDPLAGEQVEIALGQAFGALLKELGLGEDDLKGEQNVLRAFETLRNAVKPYLRPKARFVGVTREDIFGKGYSFLLALRVNNYGVLSYWRYTARFTEETPSRTRLLQRIHKQAVCSAGHVFGLARCSDPTCPRAYVHSVAEHDRKNEELCPACKKAFDKAFGR